MRHLNITISGRVQGVGFRFTAMEAAYRFNIKGFARNTPDRSVYIEAEGEEPGMELFLKWCRRGPVSAKVTDIEISEGPLIGFTEFAITH